MKKSTRILLILTALTALVAFRTPESASAHPMGNFSTNQYSAISINASTIDIQYIVDLAEIPAFQELEALGVERVEELSTEAKRTYAEQKSGALVKGLVLQLNGETLPLSVVNSEVSFPPGNGGLPTLRLEMNLLAQYKSGTAGTLVYRDENFAGRIGWKEIIAKPGEGVRLDRSSVPATDQTAALTQYSTDATSSALRVLDAQIEFSPGAAQAPNAATTGASESGDARADAPVLAGIPGGSEIAGIADFFTQDDLPVGALLIGLVVAFAWGAGHALSPGHGKTVVAAYLVGSRGTAWHAIMLGLTVTISHTIGVFLLGLVVLYAADYILPETVYPYLGVASGLLIAALGIVLFSQRLRAWKRGRAALAGAGEHSHHDHTHDDVHSHTHGMEHDHSHGHDRDHAHDHTHDHDHSHDHDSSHAHAAGVHSHGPFGKPHSHVPADGQKLGFGGLLLLGITGGIIPCPTALIVLLAAVAYHRVALGLMWILSFSLGLAVVLMGIGLAVVYGQRLVGKVRFGTASLGKSRLFARLPMASAAFVACLGFLIAFQSLTLR